MRLSQHSPSATELGRKLWTGYGQHFGWRRNAEVAQMSVNTIPFTTYYHQGELNTCLQDENLIGCLRKCFDSNIYEHPADFLVDFLVSLGRHHPELAQLMLAWGHLPAAIRQGILALVRTVEEAE